MIKLQLLCALALASGGFTSLAQSPPALVIDSNTGSQVRLSWANTPGNIVLEEADNLTPGSAWRPFPQIPTLVDGRLSVMVDMTNVRRFFRLRSIQPGGLPPDPASVAPPVAQTIATGLGPATEFLYTGPNPIQTGVVPGTIEARRVAVLRGKVAASDGAPLPAVTISVLGHPEFGQTLTRADGAFDLAVNGGGQLTLRYQKNGFPAAQRAIVAPWRDYAWLPDVVMIPFDTVVTTVDLGVAGMQVARGSAVSDADGLRRATILIPEGTTANLVMADGTSQAATSLNIRATEYTVGTSGPAAMPATLPPASGYTYCVELSADEAIAAGATGVRFNQALPVYVENFLSFPVGTPVPTGYYDREKGQWIASENGLVIKVLGVIAGMADLDFDGDGAADDAATLAAQGVTTSERARLGQLYTSGQTLWRVPVAHFTPWDCNWPFGPPGDAIHPPGENPNDPPLDDPTEECASVIGCETQTLGESVPVAGSFLRLHYGSQRTPGYKDPYTIDIPLSGPVIPASLKRIDLEIEIAGRRLTQSFGAAPNQKYMFTWDGRDAYGRTLQGQQPVTIRTGYVYQSVYYEGARPQASFAAYSFGQFSGDPGISVGANRLSAEVTFWQEMHHEVIGNWDARGSGLGGWTLDVHHVYHAGRALYFGYGKRRSAQGVGDVITTVAGKVNTFGYSGDGGPATEATLSEPSGIAVGPDGSLYIADSDNFRIRRVGPDGVITTVAGNGTSAYSGDGGPATAAAFYYPEKIAVGPDGSLYIGDSSYIRRVRPNGIITTVAGNGLGGYSGDGGLATAAGFSAGSIAVGPDGSLYIADTGNRRIRRVGPEGIITTAAGNGSSAYSGDGGPATAAGLSASQGIAVGPDGSLYIADSTRIRRVGPDGIITTAAGNGTSSYSDSGDGGAATAAVLGRGAESIAVGPDGSLYIAETLSSSIRRVGPDGIITTLAGEGGNYGFTGDGGPATAATLSNPAEIALGPDGGLYIADTASNRVRRVESTLPEGAVGEAAIPSGDGREVYIFSASGRHLKTLHALTGALRYQFGYSPDGYLTTITDGSGNVTTVERTGAASTAIVAPGGQRTALIAGADGWLLGATNPAGEAHTMGYSADGLLQTFTDPRGNIHRFTYDALGRLIKDEDPVGGSITLNRTAQSNGYTVTTTSALGRTRAYQVEHLSTGAIRRTSNGTCCGADTGTVIGTDGSEQITNDDGSVSTIQYGPDPRWGMLAPRLLKRVRTLPGGLTEITTSTRSVTLANPGNLLSLQALTDTVTVNGRTFTRTYNAATRTMTDTSAESRQTVSVLDAQGRVISQTPAPGITPITLTYDVQGRVTGLRQGTQSWTYGYDARNRVVSRTDAAGQSVGFLYDNADRLTRKTLPSGAAYQFTYDPNGNRTQVILPSGASHALGYTLLDLDTSYTPPNNASYRRTFNADKQLTRTTLPAGRFTDQTYDALGRVSGMSYPEAVTAFEYLTGDSTERVAGITNTPVAGPAQNIAYTYNGSLITGMTASGVAPAQVSYSYDDNFSPTNMTLVSGTDTVQSALLWDKDGLAIGFGPFTFTRGGPGGVLSQISDAASTTSYGYDTLGRIATRSHQVNAQATYAMQLSYDNVGRITGKTETASGTTHTYAYAYDLDGQLIEVTRDTVVSERYAYDLNGNRTSRQSGGSAVEAASYDSQDRLIQRGTVACQFNADGFLTQRGADTFRYNSRGHLLGATAGGQAITYGYDGLGRRVSRTGGSGTYLYLYGDPASHLVTAMRAPTGELTTLFYDTAGLLIALERGGARYYVATDQVGTPRVVSSSAGTVVKVVEYDSFGNLLADSNPAFDLPIGYAGGLADAASGLVHFGFRDYDPAAGRWTSRDPVLFAGGQGNLYVYVGNNAVNSRDPLGLFCISATLYSGVGGGVQTCITSEGALVCGEVGFGVGGGAGVDNGGLEESGTEIALEGSVKCGPLTLGGKAALDSKGCLKFGLKGSGDKGPVSADTGGGVGLNFEMNTPEVRLNSKCAAQGKLSGKVCIQGKF